MSETAPLVLRRDGSSRSEAHNLENANGNVVGYVLAQPSYELSWRWLIITSPRTHERGWSATLADAYDAAIEAYESAVTQVSDR